MTAYRIKLKRRFAQVGMQKSQNVSQREYPLCCVSVSGNRTAVSIQQDTEIRIAVGSVNRPAVIRFWNLFVLIYKSNPMSRRKYFFSKFIMPTTR